VQLSPNYRDLHLPKPLGYRVAQADSFLVVAAFMNATPEQERMHVRVTVAYEPLNTAQSRLAVLPLQAAAAAAAADGTGHHRSWEWQIDVNGRMLAMSGAPLQEASELVLQDATTGAVLWRRTHRSAGPAFQQATPTERLGVAVEKTGRYRLTAVYAATVRMRTEGDAVFVLILPR
jgi:hypothetical protein